MVPQRVAINFRWAGRILAWSALLATTLALAFALQALAASAFTARGPAALAVAVPGPVAVSAACQAALAAGDNQRESFLEHSCAERLTTSPSAQSEDLDRLVTPERCTPIGIGFMDSSIVAESRRMDCGWAP
jgi:hypothetical protein